VSPVANGQPVVCGGVAFFLIVEAEKLIIRRVRRSRGADL
jgi:hypothetical protein